MNKSQKLEKIAGLICESYGPLVFTIFEIGAVPLGEAGEPFHDFPSIFSGSRVVAFELDAELCKRLNQQAKPGIHYFPVALGLKNEKRILFETKHPMCSSLLRPDTELLQRFNGLEVAMPVSVSTIQTSGLDEFVRLQQFVPDFIKIDIQGAELEVFRGGIETLRSVVGVVSEVEFLPLYVNQPLFGDVCSFLSEQKITFHKFLNLAGRTLEPLVINDDSTFATQHLWADAMYLRDQAGLEKMSDEMVLKMGVLAFLYDSPDVSYCCFKQYDLRRGSALHTCVAELVG
ncbi:methyltransferase, FkbM family [Trichlorobacter thiogenes]|uniref:Methyltransferase, FkbM family n=1 Tax=Trichlorobacter thiogenes TaxID=115783 RepID=A0A1T4JWL0_9BACT|nr:FkbM family methyltransferase [Trichlorobacter thiogenes]SJZ34541.1 methyltransferase, FkbM family [Trichlorobacter thiogenes]